MDICLGSDMRARMLTSEEFDRAVSRYRKCSADSISKIIESHSDPVGFVSNPRNNYDSAFQEAVKLEVQERKAQEQAVQEAIQQQEDPFLTGFNSVKQYRWNC